MSISICTQIQCDGCMQMSAPYYCLTMVAMKERKRLKALGWRVGVTNKARKPGEVRIQLDYCPNCKPPATPPGAGSE